MINALRTAVGDRQQVALSSDPSVIENADRVVLPGVGAFAECRRKLERSGVLESLAARVHAGHPFLGVCVGMQILADRGLEFEESAGLGWIPGVARKLAFSADYSGPRKLPHVGWTSIDPQDHRLFSKVVPGSHFYFVHSFTVECANPADIAATAEYGERFTAAVLHKNIFATQFHPEKSGRAGLAVLEAFCQWNP